MAEERPPYHGLAVRGNCAVCGEACEERSISLALPRSDSGLAVVRNVPAEVCPSCGDTRFSLRTTGNLMAMFRGRDKPDDVALVPIYDLEKFVSCTE